MVSETEITTDNQAPAAAENMSVNGDCETKRSREGDESGDTDASKKQKVDDESEAEAEEEKSGPVSLGPKTFKSSMEMYEYFFKFLHNWAPNTDANKYEHLVLLDLIKKGHSDPENKIGVGAKAFQIRFHPEYKSRCFFIVREDQSVDDFSFRKCVDHILPLPENMKLSRDQPARGGGRGRGRGRGGRGGNYRR